jgi:xanthine dehydrogenase accessory factor
MISSDREVLRAALDWLEAGRATWLVTVARTWGSSPRPVGSLLAVNEDGRFAGSVSGGCVEDDLVGRLSARTFKQLPCIDTYGVTADQTARFGLPCGGRLDLLVEQLAGPASVRAVLQALDERRLIARRVCLATGEVSLHPASAPDEFRFDGRDVIKVFGPVWRLLLIGAGQLSRVTAEMALALDYDVVVCDPREDYAQNWNVPGAVLDTRMPDDAVRALARDVRSAVVALTHDPKLDDLALLEALGSGVFYVGALGSRANNARRRERLRKMGLASAQLERLHGPVGLPIGSRTPAEIALAILAELTALRHGVDLQAVDAAQGVRPAAQAIEQDEGACPGRRASC